jgi:ferredoxin
MKMYVDPKKCQGHNRCYALAPDLFDVDDYGLSTAKPEAVPAGSEELAHLVVANCPEDAISIVED